ncbi:MAG: class I SAM-dependent methyltransferase [Candidatus Daviesbacteria bacterium]|nr:class I SAM-dependent methyltransferase [Candidatus Daviesbacteria bacterium]
MSKSYQFGYAAGRPQMYDATSRVKKAERIVKILTDYFGAKNLKNLSVLDVGTSSGIIDNTLAPHFKKVIGIDIDVEAIKYANKSFRKKNLEFKVADALELPFKEKTFEVVICTHVYEHVSNPSKLFKEIYKVLSPGGVCFLAAVNKWWILEPHYDLPFLSWLPKNIAHYYVKAFGKASTYYETLFSYWTLKRLNQQFHILEYTSKVLQQPKKYGFDDVLPDKSFLSLVAYLFSPLAQYYSPTLFWLLKK